MDAFIAGFLQFLDEGLLNLAWWQIIVVALVFTHLTIASVTIFLHRCMAHRALDLHAIPSHFMRFWLWLTTGMVTKEWTAVHRKHHAKCEAEGDPHSPKLFGLKTVLLEGSELYRTESKIQETLDKYGRGTPDDWLERNVYTGHSVSGVVLMMIINILLFGVAGIAVWGLQMIWIPVTAAGIINGLGHAKGYRNFDIVDASTNLLPWGIIIGGEELHNNHHAYPTSARLSSKWYEFDIGWMYIRLMEMMGLASVRKTAPRPRLDSNATPKPADAQTLQTVIALRYELMAEYGSTIKNACAEEAARLKAIKHPEFALLKSARHWLHLDAGKWTGEHREHLATICEASSRVEFLVHMREELASLWESANESREQLVEKLQKWCERAEASGVNALQELSVRMRSYSAV
ncbi:MAG: fatty acid desaturase [Burkholderiaceae bacterium]